MPQMFAWSLAYVFPPIRVGTPCWCRKKLLGMPRGVALLKQISPVAWQHINFYGRYEFTKVPTPINLDGIVAELAQRPLVPPEESTNGTIS